MVAKGPESKAPADPHDELGAHVSAAGGMELAPARAREIGAVVLQLFTKQPNRWAEPRMDASRIRAFRAQREAHGIRTVVAHDSRGSRRDRHADIGAGMLGDEPFRRLVCERRLRPIPKILETPKGTDAVASDRRNLDRLRSYRA